MSGMIEALFGVAVAVVLGWAGIKWARRNERKRIKQDDQDRAEDIRNRADRADERVREFDDSGWRD